MYVYTLHDFLEYPDMGVKLMLCAPFDWASNAGKPRHSWLKRLICPLTVVNVFYPCVGMLIYFLEPSVRSYAYDTDVPTIGQVFEMFAVIFYLALGLSRFCNLCTKRQRITALLREFHSIFPGADHQRPQRNQTGPSYRPQHFARKLRELNKRHIFAYMIALAYFNLLPILKLIYEDLSADIQVNYRAQTHTWYPWETEKFFQTPRCFVISYLVQAIASFTTMCFILSDEFFFCLFITQMELHLNFLTDALASLDASSAAAEERLRFLIAYHNRLLRLACEINDIFNITFLVNLTTSSIAISMMGLATVMISMADGLKYGSGVVFFLMMNYFFCHNGERFAQASDRLRPALFYGNWYEGSLSYRRMVLFFIMRTTKSTELRAYGYMPISMQTYMNIVKISYQLFTFFRTMDY